MGNTVGTNAWKKLDGGTGHRRISGKRKGNVLSSCVTPAYMIALETTAPTEKNTGEGTRFAKNNLVRIIVGVTRADNRK